MDRPRFGALTVGARVLRRQIVAAPGAAVTIFVAVLLTALFVTAVPRLLERVSTDDLRESLTEAEPEERNLTAESVGRLVAGNGGNPFVNVVSRGEGLLQRGIPESVKSVVTETHFVVESAQFSVSSFPDGVEGPFPTFFRFRHQDGIEGEVELVAGSMPALRDPIPMLVGQQCPDDPLHTEGFVERQDIECRVVDTPVFETAITVETAEAMMLGVGDQVLIHPDTADILWGLGALGQQEGYVLAISGIVELSDIDVAIWFADPALHRPRIRENPDFRLIFATGIMAPSAYAEILSAAPLGDFRYTWRYFVDPALVEADEAEALRADVDKILPQQGETVVTFLPELIDEYLERRALTVRLMSTAVAGLVAAGVGAVLVLAALIAERHSRSTVLIRDRGASRGQLALTSLYSGILLVVPASIVGYLVTAALLGGTDPLAPGRGSAAIAAGGAAAVVVANSPLVFRRLGALRRLDSMTQPRSTKRIVLEVFVLVAAVAAVALLRRRGMADAPPSLELDPLLAVAPALIGVAVGIILIRLVRPVMRALSWIGARGRALVAFIGLRRLVEVSPASRAPTLVILLSVAVALFSSVVQTSLERGQEEHSWQLIGADFRVEGHRTGVPLTGVDPEALAAGSRWAEAVLVPDVEVLGAAQSPVVRLLAVDIASYREVVEGSPVDLAALEPLTDPGDVAVPVLVSEDWPAQASPSPGTQLSLEMGTVDPAVVVAGVVDRFPSLSPGIPFIVMDLARLRQTMGDLPVRTTTLLLQSPPEASEQIEGRLRSMYALAGFRSRHQVADDLAGDPFALWVDRGLAVVLYMGVGFAAIAAVSLLTVTAARRRRDLGYLRTLGLAPSQATAITVWEQMPTVLLATGVGAVTGALTARLLAPALDIESFTGGLFPAEIVVEPLPIIVTTAVVMAVLGVAVAIFVLATRTEDYGRLLKVGDE
jgi:putative ABC transport system permease protein